MPTDVPAAADAPLFTERLWPSPGIWFLTIAFGAALGLIPAPISATAALVTGVVGVVVFTTFLILSTPQVQLTPERFSAGRAGVPLAVVSAVETLDREAMRQARGVRLDARAYLCMRGWLPLGVRVGLDDPDDPTPYWLISSRHPDALAKAVTSVAGRGRPPR